MLCFNEILIPWEQFPALCKFVKSGLLETHCKPIKGRLRQIYRQLQPTDNYQQPMVANKEHDSC